jgi:hypothetical protein
VLSAGGKVVSSITAPSGLLGARVQDGRLVLMTKTAVLAGSRHWPLATGVDLPPPDLLGGYGNYVLYRRGAVHLLRLSDGRDRPLSAGGQAPPVDAQLGKRGLFYLYNQLYTRKPGRILFVPYSKLNALVRAG